METPPSLFEELRIPSRGPAAEQAVDAVPSGRSARFAPKVKNALPALAQRGRAVPRRNHGHRGTMVREIVMSSGSQLGKSSGPHFLGYVATALPR